jgi:hypothetical protein
VKTTIEVPDELFNRVKRLAKRTGRPFRALVEEGLRHVLGTQQGRAGRYEPPDCSVGDANGVNPLDALSWQDLRDEIYGTRRGP